MMYWPSARESSLRASDIPHSSTTSRRYVIISCLTISLLNLTSLFQALGWMYCRDCLVSAQFYLESKGV